MRHLLLTMLTESVAGESDWSDQLADTSHKDLIGLSDAADTLRADLAELQRQIAVLLHETGFTSMKQGENVIVVSPKISARRVIDEDMFWGLAERLPVRRLFNPNMVRIGAMRAEVLAAGMPADAADVLFTQGAVDWSAPRLGRVPVDRWKRAGGRVKEDDDE